MPGQEDDFADVHRYVLQLLGQDLELIGRSHLELSAACIARNIGYRDNDYVAESCRDLVEYGLLERAQDAPYYSITDEGLAYLAGESELG